MQSRSKIFKKKIFYKNFRKQFSKKKKNFK